MAPFHRLSSLQGSLPEAPWLGGGGQKGHWEATPPPNQPAIPLTSPTQSGHPHQGAGHWQQRTRPGQNTWQGTGTPQQSPLLGSPRSTYSPGREACSSLPCWFSSASSYQTSPLRRDPACRTSWPQEVTGHHKDCRGGGTKSGVSRAMQTGLSGSPADTRGYRKCTPVKRATRAWSPHVRSEYSGRPLLCQASQYPRASTGRCLPPGPPRAPSTQEHDSGPRLFPAAEAWPTPSTRDALRGVREARAPLPERQRGARGLLLRERDPAGDVRPREGSQACTRAPSLS